MDYHHCQETRRLTLPPSEKGQTRLNNKADFPNLKDPLARRGCHKLYSLEHKCEGIQTRYYV